MADQRVIDSVVTDRFSLYNGDCAEVLRGLPDSSVHYSIFSPPFVSLFVYSPSERDVGNCRTTEEFFAHFHFVAEQIFRVMRSGRLMSVHCWLVPTQKSIHGHIGFMDFRGDLIREFERVGFYFHSEVCIWKDPVLAMQRTKALGLLYKQLRKDSAMSRMGAAEFLCTFRKPGKNEDPVEHTVEDFPLEVWQRYASPVWVTTSGIDSEGFGVCSNQQSHDGRSSIDPGDTLQYRSAREHEDERHICPLQLEVIRRGVRLWSNPGEVVLSPFAGIGSEGFVALEMKRRFVGVELKRSYYEQAANNLAEAEIERQPSLFGEIG